MTLSAQEDSQIKRFERMMFRFGPTIIGLSLFCLMTAIFLFGYQDVYYAILKWWGIMPYHYPFVDMKIVLTAIDCSRHAIDIYAPNTCMYGGWYSYSPLLLGTAKLPVGPDDHKWFGFFLAIAFLASLSALPPSLSWKECWIRTLATISTVTVFGLERTEFDVPIFMIVLAGLVLALRQSRVRFVGYAVFVFAAILKYYPIVLMLLVARERFRTALWIAAATIAAVCLFIVATMSETAQVVGLAPVGSPFADYFGARNVPLGVTLLELGPQPLTDDGLLRIPLTVLGHVVLGLLLVFAAWTAGRSFRADCSRVSGLPQAQLAYLVAGSVVMVGCFFAVQNAGPRAIFLLMTLPGLFVMARTGCDGSMRHSLKLVYGVVFLLWEGLFHGLEGALSFHLPAIAPLHFFYWLARELVWWWVMARLASLLIAFLWRSPALAPVLDFLRIPRPGHAPAAG